MYINLIGFIQHWDPYPFNLLNLLFSTQSAYTAPIIMMSQNRQSERDRDQVKADYQTNLQTKIEIEKITEKLNSLEIEKLDKMIVILEEIKRQKGN